MSYTTDVGPFSITPRWVRRGCKSEPWALAVYVTLADLADRDLDNGWTIGREDLATMVGTSASTIDRAVKHLLGLGAIEVERNRKGKEWTWSRYLVRMVNPQPQLQVVTSGTGVLTGDDIPENPLQESSLRSEVLESSSMSTQEQKVAPEHQKIAQEFWDWHVAENGGPPALAFTKLMAVAKAALKRGYSADKILDAMKLERRGITSAKVIDRIGYERRARENQPSTAAIPSEVVKAFAAAAPFLSERWGPTWLVDRPALMGVVTRMVRLGYGIGETMIRLAVGARSPQLDSEFWLMNIDIPRFQGALADVPGSMAIAYANKGWRL